jgi:hypothetical protein
MELAGKNLPEDITGPPYLFLGLKGDGSLYLTKAVTIMYSREGTTVRLCLTDNIPEKIRQMRLRRG